MSEKELMKVYEAKRKKYKLPSLLDLQKEFKFSLSDIKADENVILISIRKEIRDLLTNFIGDTESIVSGSDRFCCNIERRAFSREERRKLFQTYIKMQQFFWQSKIVFLKDEADVAKWINDFYKAWKDELKEKMLQYNSRMRKSWEDVKEYRAELKYVG